MIVELSTGDLARALFFIMVHVSRHPSAIPEGFQTQRDYLVSTLSVRPAAHFGPES
jgi:hypothetical protein